MIFINSHIKSSWEEMLHGALTKYTDIPTTEWSKLLELLKVHSVNRNDHLVHVGDVPDKMMFIISGIFRVYYVTSKGDEKTLVFRIENDFLSAYSSFLENTKSIYAIQALDRGTLLYITIDEYRNLSSNHVCWQNFSGRYAERLFLEKERREMELLTVDAAERYRIFKRDFSAIEKRIPNYLIASYLGITPVALSRIRKKV